MSKIKKILILCFILFVLLTSVCMAAQAVPASENPLARTPTNKSATILNTDLYLAENDVVVEDTVNGNAFVYGQNVTISGNIDGDLLVAANNLTIAEDATISGNVFAFASTISFKGKASDVYAFSQKFNLESSGVISRDLRLYASEFTISGIVERDAYLSIGQILVNDNATSALIKGNLHYSAETEMDIPEGIVAGETKFTQTTSEEPSTAEIILSYVTSFINVLIYAVVVVLICVFLTPKFAAKATYCLEKKAFITAGIGILGIVLLPIISIMLIATGYLLYVGIALLTVTILILSLSIALLGISIGNFIANKLKNKTTGKVILWSIVSVAVIWLLQRIPVIGSWISIFTVVFGLGIFIYSLFIRKDINELNATNK